MELTLPFNLREWIEENRELLKPPVGNQQLFAGEEFIVMVVGGPNARDDYHYDVGPELFYQLEGEIVLKTMQDGEPRDIPIRAGDVFLLPPGIPHSPQRFEGSVGLVVERQRAPHEQDGFMWFCASCNHKLYEEYLHVANIVEDLPPVFERFYSDEAARTCDRCGTVMPAR